jgi:phosphomannomutase
MNNESANIFRAYDIRGTVGKDLTYDVMERIGLSFAAYSGKNIVLAHDVRIHSPEMKNAFLRGFLSVGFSAEDCGLLPIGAAMFHAWKERKELAFITASHLTKEWNGVKFFHSDGRGFMENENYAIRDIFMKNMAEKGKEKGKAVYFDGRRILAEYSAYLNKKIKMKNHINVVLDCGNGCAGLLAPRIFEEAGCGTDIIFGEIDGTFPNRLPDPIERELGVLKRRVIGSDMGIAYDGDGDRTALIDDKGNFLVPEETSYIILSQLLKKEKGPVIANVECTRIIDMIAAKFNRKVIRVPVGHTFLTEAVHRYKASYGVESAAHYAIPSLVPFDDAMVIGFYVAYVLSSTEMKLSEFRKEVPRTFFERRSFVCPDHVKFEIMGDLSRKLSEIYENINTMDGIRIDLGGGWVLIRASNTSPYIRVTVEGETEKDKAELQEMFIAYLSKEMAKHGLELVAEHK